MGNVCNDQGLVVDELDDNRVRVRVLRGEACGSCAIKGVCGAMGGLEKEVEMVLPNSVGAARGDTVSIVISEGALLLASAILYLIPAAMLITGAVVGHFIYQDAPDPDPAVAVGAGFGLVSGLLISGLAGKLALKKKSMVPRLSGIISKNQQSR